MNELEKWIPKPCSLSAEKITEMRIYYILGTYTFPWSKPCVLLLKPSGIWITLHIFMSCQMLFKLCVTFYGLILAYWWYPKFEVQGIARLYLLWYVIFCHITFWCHCMQCRRVALDVFGNRRRCFSSIRVSFHFLWGRTYLSGCICPCLIASCIESLPSCL